MPRSNLMKFGLLIAALAILSVLVYQIPAINTRLSWRLDIAKTYLRNVIYPVGQMPTPLPHPVSEVTIYPTEIPTIQITGPLNIPVITNEATGEVIKLNYHVPSDAIVTISLACGNKTVIDDDDVSRIGLVDENVSDLATFHIEPAPGAAGGINTINVTGSGATDNTQIIISYNTCYIGI